jgi:pimeloyl-ACP methyl ester carboxylesterase
MPFAEVNRVRVHYHTAGGSRSGLVFVHGYTGSLAGWEQQVTAFAGEHQILAADHWGHGESGAPGSSSGYDVEQVARDVLALAEIAGLDHFHLVGHSLGGAVVQEIALHSPEHLLSLTLTGTTDWFGDHDAGSGPEVRRELDAAERARLDQLSAEVLSATWQALLRWRGTANRARTIQVPTLVVHGEQDARKIIEGSRRLATAIPDAELVTIPGAGHDPHLEQPNRFNVVLQRFLAAR